MKKRYVLLALTSVLTLALVVPALGGPSNPIAEIAGIKQQVKKATKKAKKANRKANKANKRAKKANRNALAADRKATGFGVTADFASEVADSARDSAVLANAAANAAQSAADAAQSTADANAQKLSCPTGMTLIGGICIEDDLRSADDYFAAEDVCQVAGRFLPGVDDLMHYLHKTGKDPGIAGKQEEWTYERIDNASSSKVNLVGGIPRHESEPIATELPFRCTTYAG